MNNRGCCSQPTWHQESVTSEAVEETDAPGVSSIIAEAMVMSFLKTPGTEEAYPLNSVEQLVLSVVHVVP